MFTAKFGSKAHSGVQPPDRHRTHRGDPAASVGSAINRRIMNHHDFAIASHPHVEFAHIGAQLSGGDECAQSVFRIKSAGSAMRDRQHLEQHRARRHKSSPTTLIEADFTHRPP